MEVHALALSLAAREWEEQSQDLDAASKQLADQSVAGFSPIVARAALDFLASWSRLTRDLSTTCGDRSDVVRRCLDDYLATDQLAHHDLFFLALIAERR